MAVTTILSDIDRTLIDSNDLHVPAREEAFAQPGTFSIAEQCTIR